MHFKRAFFNLLIKTIAIYIIKNPSKPWKYIWGDPTLKIENLQNS